MVQLLPFQKLADVPETAQRHRLAIRGLAIASIVLISLLLIMFITTMILAPAMSMYHAFIISMFGIPLMVLSFVLVLVGNVISLRNMNTWEPTDVCCNLMRSQPACCTKSCGGNKKCCARLSCVYVLASVFTSLLFVLFVAVLAFGCSQSSYYSYHNRYSYYGDVDYRKYSTDGYHYDTSSTTTTIPSNPRCGVFSAFEVPTLLLLLSLVIITMRTAHLVCQIENNQPDIELLPPNKMVVQDIPNSAMVTPREVTIVSEPCDVAAKETSERESEQNA